MKIDKQTVVTVAVIGGLLGLLLVCSIVESLRLPMCAIQVFMIGLVSLKWEEDAWLATGPNRKNILVSKLMTDKQCQQVRIG